LLQLVTDCHAPTGEVREVHVIPSGDVITAFEPTATNKLSANVIACQSLSLADVRETQSVPFVEVITRLPVPDEATATNFPLP
jgi:glutamate racemase